MTRTDAAAMLRKFLETNDPVDRARWEERVIAAMMFAPADPATGYQPPPVLMTPPKGDPTGPWVPVVIGGDTPAGAM